MPEATPGDLALALARAGLIQFGRFAQLDGSVWPVQVNLLWLPSYPALLSDVAAALVPVLARVPADRLLTTVEAIPTGVALSLRAGLPMTYPYGTIRDTTAVYAIEGAYDVGHPTVLLSDLLIDAVQAERIAGLARRVGLNVFAVLAILDLGRGARGALNERGYSVEALLTLHETLPVLEAAGWLPRRMRNAVETWITGG